MQVMLGALGTVEFERLSEKAENALILHPENLYSLYKEGATGR